MPAVTDVLVVGAGAAGSAVAVLLAQAGVRVTMAEIKPDVTALGSGITLQGNALRVLRQLGIWEQAQERGYCFDTVGFRAPDQDGSLIMEVPDARLGGPDLPATMGMYRPDLAKLLVDRATSVGVEIRYGTTVSSFETLQERVSVMQCHAHRSDLRRTLVYRRLRPYGRGLAVLLHR